MRPILLALTLSLLAAAPLMAAETTAANVPVTHVALFSSGVGYFEHTGSVEGDATMPLMFKTDQINDVLKSMLLADLGGGTVTSVNYASQDPLTRALQSFAIDLSGAPNMAALLSQLRGAEVIVSAPEKIEGRVLGVEIQTRQVGTGPNPTILNEAVLNLVTAGGVKSLPMSAVQNIELADQRLSGELRKALELLLSSRDTQRKSVDIHFAGKGKREVRVGYITETPVWKTSYRLELSDKKPLIQGWAIVENTTDSDWSNVKLSLVSGRPISFIQDLYTPLYLPRPTVVPEMYANLRPQMYEEGMVKTSEVGQRKEMARAARPMMMRGVALGGSGVAPAPIAEMMDTLKREPELLAYQPAAAEGGSIGELFNYSLKEPVSLPRQRSAMLPIINSAISAEKVSIYNQSVMPKTPLNGAYLTNDTGLKLLGGPVTVLDDGMYAGDARIDNLVPGDKRLISYAVDLAMTVDPSVKNDSRITSVKIVKGVLLVKRLNAFSQTYAIKNKADAKRQIIVEHPFMNERKLIAPEKYEEKTPTLYRFRLSVEPNAMKDFVVKEEMTYYETIALLGSAPDAFSWYSTNGEISKGVREALAKAIAMKGKLTDLQAKAGEIEKQLASIKSGQDRLRRNIETAGRDSTLGRRYLDKLSQEENTIEQLDKDLAATRAAIDNQNKELADYLANLNVD
jgi:hypothetical protein